MWRDSLKCVCILFLTNFHFQVLASIDTCWNECNLICKMVIFSYSIIHSTFIKWHSTIKKAFLLMHVVSTYLFSIYLFIITMNSHMDSYFIHRVALLLKLSQIWPLRVPSNWLLYPFDKSSSFFEHFVTSWHEKTFQSSSCFPSMSPGVSHFSKEH